MVGFLHNHMVKSSEEHKVRRWCGRSKRHKEIPVHEVVTDYNLYMGGVDAKDKDTADWSVSLKSLRFYLRIFYWQFDSVIHAMWVLVKHTVGLLSQEELRIDAWKSFASKDSGRFDFQMTLGTKLIKTGLEWDWKGDFTNLDGRPAYARQINLVPCACPSNKQCFFCHYGHTHGMDHRKKNQKRISKGKDLVVPVGHSEIPEKIRKHSQYCRICHRRERENDPEGTNQVIKNRCSKTWKGCPGCNSGKGLIVCDFCWQGYDHSL